MEVSAAPDIVPDRDPSAAGDPAAGAEVSEKRNCMWRLRMVNIVVATILGVVCVVVSILDPLAYDLYWSLGIYIPIICVMVVTVVAWQQGARPWMVAAVVGLVSCSIGMLVFLVSGVKKFGPVHVGVIVVLPPTISLAAFGCQSLRHTSKSEPYSYDDVK